MSSFSVRKSSKREAFSIVQDALLEHPTLSLNARTVLAWMLGRPDGWVIQIKYMLDKLHITDNVWRTVKRDLIKGGFFSQTRFKNEDGKFTWVQEVTDEPLYQETKNHPLKTTDGSPTHGKQQIKQDIYKQNNFTIPPTKSFLPQQAVDADKTSSENLILELDFSVSHQLKKVLEQSKTLLIEINNQKLADALEASLRLGEATGNKVRFPNKVLEYLKTLSPETLEERGQTIAVEREKKKVDAVRQHARELSFKLNPDIEARAKGNRILQKVRSDRIQKSINQHEIITT
jgi:hypothetical protein